MAKAAGSPELGQEMEGIIEEGKEILEEQMAPRR
jgi:hypothetical protein